MTNIRITIIYVCLFIVIVSARREKFIMDERYVCRVKTSCVECLKLAHCSWCQTENKCFSKKLSEFEGFCSNNTIDHEDYGLSFSDNAECSCSTEVKQRCYPPGVESGPECSGRGKCVCGQCMCLSVSNPEEPTKMVMGEYCEFDNFSCEGPKCTEGPYLINDPTNVEDGSAKIPEVDLPVS